MLSWGRGGGGAPSDRHGLMIELWFGIKALSDFAKFHLVSFVLPACVMLCSHRSWQLKFKQPVLFMLHMRSLFNIAFQAVLP